MNTGLTEDIRRTFALKALWDDDPVDFVTYQPFGHLEALSTFLAAIRIGADMLLFDGAICPMNHNKREIGRFPEVFAYRARKIGNWNRKPLISRCGGFNMQENTFNLWHRCTHGFLDACHSDFRFRKVV